MASAVDISNVALSNLGSDAIVSSLDPPDGSVEAGHCARFLPIARVELLELFPWRFALARSALALGTNPSSVWTYAYALPADMVRAWRVLQAGSQRFDPFAGATEVAAILPDERGSAAFTIEGGLLLTHEPEAVLLYARDITDTSRFSPTFTTSLGYLLSSFLAGPLVKGSEGARTSREFRKMARDHAATAAVSDANSGTEPADYEAGSIQARA